MCIGGEGEVGDDSAEVKHGGELNAEFARGVNGDAELECLADCGSFDAGPDSSPESCVKQDDIHCGIENVCRKLFEVDNNCVGGERHADLAASAAHAI